MAPEVEGGKEGFFNFGDVRVYTYFPPLMEEKRTVKLLFSDFLVWTPLSSHETKLS